MTDDTIRFYKVDTGSELVALAEVSLFQGVYLRGWHILNRGGNIEVVGPHKVYCDPQTGEERIFPLLHFETEENERRWINRVKEEYMRWSAHTESPPLPSLGDVEDKG